MDLRCLRSGSATIRRQLWQSRRSAQQPYRCLSCALRQLQEQPNGDAASSGTRSSGSASDGPTTHFGYQTVAESMKEAKVGAVFSSVASSYDTMNDLMSLGIHRLWKDYFVRSLDPGVRLIDAPTPSNSPSSSIDGSPTTQDATRKGWKILDVAGGTGDIAFRLLDHATLIHGDRHSHVTVADINPDMLAEGRKRTTAEPRAWDTSRIDFVEANAETMQFIQDESIDLYTVAFGIRNFTNKAAALREAYRVLRPGGVFACLEFSKVNPSIPFFDAIYKRWSFSAIPLIGQLVAGDRDSYQYLVESIDRFPSQLEFQSMIEAAGFLIPIGKRGTEGRKPGEGKGWVDLTGGVAAVHKGVKPVRPV
ncbi:MAG: 2-hexaprenyl-6-methoxy-1,4-benzoquinone methyltransferase [Lichina confinis]|nr:MAG: 2-hexaprenyl-6-methoxy-1,4-benzoquinone methyltransferase [Lichina confinis]